ncbi:MAG: hypothetical protein ABF868_04720 [Sporolactobacillus sp.]
MKEASRDAAAELLFNTLRKSMIFAVIPRKAEVRGRLLETGLAVFYTGHSLMRMARLVLKSSILMAVRLKKSGHRTRTVARYLVDAGYKDEAARFEFLTAFCILCINGKSALCHLNG